MEDSLKPEDLQRFIPFDELSATAVQELIPHFRVSQKGAGKIVFKRGVQDEDCHFLLEGTLDLADESFKVITIHGDAEENLLALDASHPVHRSAAITKTACTIASIKRDYLQLISTWVELSGELPTDEDTDWLETLLTSDLFSHFPPSNIQQLLARFEEREVKLGDVIIREGDTADECFVLKEGRAVVTRTHNHHVTTLAALSSGALFGEDSLISQLPRSASITMSSDGVVLALSRENFNSLMKTPVLEYIAESELPDLLENSDVGVIILDVRSRQDAADSPILHARHVALSDLRALIPTLSSSFLYIVAGETRAEAAAYILSEAGLDVRVLSH